MRLTPTLILLACSVVVRFVEAGTNSWALGPSHRLVAAPVDRATEVLTAPDEFLAGLSPFDRSARMRTNGPVTREQFAWFVAGQVLPWADQDLILLDGLASSLSNRIAGWNLPLPETVLVIKTTGDEEGDAAYTRGTAIVLPASDLNRKPADLERILLHELFHVLSRRNPRLRNVLYAQIGFHPCGTVVLPPDYAARKLTNPDAPVIEHRLAVRAGGREIQVMPVLFSRQATVSTGDPRPFFAYLEFRLMEIERGKTGLDWQPVVRDGQPVFHQPAEAGNFFEQIGRNTGYVIHPEEVLADNFALLMLGSQDVPNPEIITRLAAALRGFVPADGPR